MNQKLRPIEFGANYFPHVDRIRDFFPHWIENEWTLMAMETDLFILRALGGRIVRYHIHPINYTADRYPGAEASDYRKKVPFLFATAKRLGMATHLDLHTDNFAALNIQDVVARVVEIGFEKIDIVQVINEYFFLWRDLSNRDKLLEIFDALRRAGYKGLLCFDAGGSIHREIRETHPRLAAFVEEVLPLHHYTYGAKWDSLGEDTFLDLLTGCRTIDNSSLSTEERKYYESMTRESFGGLSRSLRVMEINMTGFPFWVSSDREERGSRWPGLMERLSRETNVSTVCHFALKGKMSWREYGLVHCGLLYASGLPRPEAAIFRDTAMQFMPPDDIFASVELRAQDGIDGDLIVSIMNKTGRSHKGILSVGSERREIDLPPQSEAEHYFKQPIPFSRNGAIEHFFPRFEPANASLGGGACIAWHPRVNARPCKLKTSTRFAIKGVRYASPLASIDQFLETNRHRLSIIVHRPAGPEMELAVRLQSIITEAWGIVPSIHSVIEGAAEAISRDALILIGVRHEHALMSLAENLASSECTPAGAEVVISSHSHLFTTAPRPDRSPASHWMRAAGDAVLSPGVLLVNASSFDLLRSGIHDLIQRIHPAGKSAVGFSDKNSHEAFSGLRLSKARRFKILLPAGKMAISVAIGSKLLTERFGTAIRLLPTGANRAYLSQDGVKRLNTIYQHNGGVLEIEFAPTKGRPACPAALTIRCVETGKSLFRGYFHETPRVDLDYDDYEQITSSTRYGNARAVKNWMEIRTAENELRERPKHYGWSR